MSRSAMEEVLEEAARLGLSQKISDALRASIGELGFYEELHGDAVVPGPYEAQTPEEEVLAMAVANVRQRRGAELSGRIGQVEALSAEGRRTRSDERDRRDREIALLAKSNPKCTAEKLRRLVDADSEIRKRVLGEGKWDYGVEIAPENPGVRTYERAIARFSK